MLSTLRYALPVALCRHQPGPLDVDVDALLARSHARFGALRMEGDGGAGGGDGGAGGAGGASGAGDGAGGAGAGSGAGDAGKNSTGDDEDDPKLGPAGEKAYQAEKVKRREAQALRREAEAQLREWKDLGKTAAEIKALIEGSASGKDGGDKGSQPDVEAIRAQARREADAAVLTDRVMDKIEAKAAKGFADPDDAAALLMRGRDPKDFLDGDGKVDGEAIEDALKELLEKKPHLAAQGGRRFGGGADGGARKEEPSKPKSLEDAVTRHFAGTGT
jgi:hypothetical protein